MKKQDLWKVIVVITVLVVVTSLIIISFYKELNKNEEINSFEECAEAGYPIGESHPRQCWTPEGGHFVEVINNSNRNYHSRDVEECSRTQLLCVEGMKFFSDETGCGCEVVDEERHFCSDDSRDADLCITLYDPVCGWNDPEKIKCIKFPCASTYSNSCNACKNSDVLYWTSGVCPE